MELLLTLTTEDKLEDDRQISNEACGYSRTSFIPNWLTHLTPLLTPHSQLPPHPSLLTPSLIYTFLTHTHPTPSLPPSLPHSLHTLIPTHSHHPTQHPSFAPHPHTLHILTTHPTLGTVHPASIRVFGEKSHPTVPGGAQDSAHLQHKFLCTKSLIAVILW